MTKLSPAQADALSRLTDDYRSAYELKASLATLDALVKKGVAERKIDALGAMFSPRTATRYRLRQSS